MTYPTAAEVAATYAKAQAAEQARLAAERKAVHRLFEKINASLRKMRTKETQWTGSELENTT